MQMQLWQFYNDNLLLFEINSKCKKTASSFKIKILFT